MASLKFVLVHGTAEATEYLKQHCLKYVCSHVYAPQLEETIDVTSVLCAYKVQLSERLMSNRIFRKVSIQVSRFILCCLYLIPRNDLILVRFLCREDRRRNAVFTTLLNPSSPHKPILVSDLKMADLKQFLADDGVQVEFAGGALRCGEYGGGAGSQQVVIEGHEGPACEDYYKIREYLYSHFYFL
ncbi:putative cleavage and polyadenylation specificity factor 2 [Rosa chinensis]|uniref:Cleavage and polyadenylation specificity factor subunit 2 n=1 Tax=Rosa chinensis TaxID=74649 RepID=A0A2P6SNN0_ROSCH|nr:putative cleavage and polyadenylation specificity factor 2 [Rosa chinensis]